jgi:hypothetical protein
MTTINQLPLITSLAAGDQLVLWATNNGDSRRSSLGAVAAYTLANPAITGTATLNGQTVTLGDNDSGGTGFRVLRVPNA